MWGGPPPPGDHGAGPVVVIVRINQGLVEVGKALQLDEIARADDEPDGQNGEENDEGPATEGR